MAAVRFDLGLAGAARADAAAEARHLDALARQARQQIFELRQLHLQLALLGAGAQGEDIEYQRGAVDDAHIGGALDILDLGGRQLAVRNDQVDLLLTAERGDLLQLARAHIGAALYAGELLRQRDDRLGARALHQLVQLVERRLGIIIPRIHADQQRAGDFFFVTDHFHGQIPF